MSRSLYAFWFVLSFWVLFAIGWIANVWQVWVQMPGTLGEATPMWLFKVVSIFIAPLGSILGFIGMF